MCGVRTVPNVPNNLAIDAAVVDAIAVVVIVVVVSL
jgi:hypothetical protein